MFKEQKLRLLIDVYESMAKSARLLANAQHLAENKRIYASIAEVYEGVIADLTELAG